jgi:hypothetical protein
MANRGVRLVRDVKLDGKATLVTPVITPEGSVSSEMAFYKGQRLRVPCRGFRLNLCGRILPGIFACV